MCWSRVSCKEQCCKNAMLQRTVGSIHGTKRGSDDGEVQLLLLLLLVHKSLLAQADDEVDDDRYRQKSKSRLPTHTKALYPFLSHTDDIDDDRTVSSRSPSLLDSCGEEERWAVLLSQRAAMWTIKIFACCMLPFAYPSSHRPCPSCAITVPPRHSFSKINKTHKSSTHDRKIIRTKLLSSV
jgi:hypothetical protein